MCPVCGGRFEKKDWVDRGSKQIDGKTRRLRIERRKCRSCGKTHRFLPDICLPYKHYEAEAVEDVIDGTITEESLVEDASPSDTTLWRWRKWAKGILVNIEGHIRSAGYRILDMEEEFLIAGRSLLEELKERLSYGWLSAAMRVYINTGGT